MSINNDLPPLRCYYCNKNFAGFKTLKDQVDLKAYFEANGVERYCCRMILMTEYERK